MTIPIVPDYNHLGLLAILIYLEVFHSVIHYELWDSMHSLYPRALLSIYIAYSHNVIDVMHTLYKLHIALV